MTCKRFNEVSYLVFILIAFYTSSSWIDVVGVRIEMPLMINVVPEGWKIASYVSLVTQLANVGPILYTIVSKVRSRINKRKASNYHSKKDVVLSFAIISIEVVSMLLISIFWNHPTYVSGKKHSVVLMVLLCCSGLCSCLSSLVFLPYMARYPAHYISAFYLGNGLSGIIPGFIGMSQGLGEEPTCLNVTVFANKSCSTSNCTDSSLQYKLIPQYPPPRFSVQVYFIIISCLLVASLVSFCCLNYTRLRRHQVPRDNLCQAAEEQVEEQDVPPDQTIVEKTFIYIIKVDKKVYSTMELALYLSALGISQFALFGFLPSILPYVCLPYGNKVFNITVRLSYVYGGLVSVLTLFIPRPSEKVVLVFGLFGLTGFVYLLVLGLQSPHPILQHEIAGYVLVVCI